MQTQTEKTAKAIVELLNQPTSVLELVVAELPERDLQLIAFALEVLIAANAR